ncbi:MAG: hypothetical protein Q9186_005232 [Xanthomendoza sp. 1 TL-2023]
MSTAPDQDMMPSGGSAQAADKSGIGNFENALRGMILGHQITSQVPEPTLPQQPPTVSSSLPSEIQPALMPNQQHAPSTQIDRPSLRDRSNPQSKNSPGRRKSRIVEAQNAAALLSTSGDDPPQFSVKQVKQPRHRQATQAGVAQPNTYPSAAATTSAEQSLADNSHATLHSQIQPGQQQPSSGLKWIPPTNFQTNARPANRPIVPQVVSQRQSQRQSLPSWSRGSQQGNQSPMPQPSSYTRPAPQHQRLYDPHAASQQSYQPPFIRGMTSSRLRSTQSHQATVQAQIDFLISIAQIQVAKAVIPSEEEQGKEVMRQILESVCQDAVREYEMAKEPLFDGSTVSLKCFGSLSTGFATRSSDMDLALESPMSKPDTASPESEIPRVLEKALLDLGYGARLLTRTRVPIIRFCEKPTPDLAARLQEERLKWEKERVAQSKPKEKVSSQAPKAVTIGKKLKCANEKQAKGIPSTTNREADKVDGNLQNTNSQSSSQNTQAKEDFGSNLVVKNELVDDAPRKNNPVEDVPVEGGDGPLGDQERPPGDIAVPISSAFIRSPYESMEASHGLRDPVTGGSAVTQDPITNHEDPRDHQHLSLSDKQISSDHSSRPSLASEKFQMSASKEPTIPIARESPVGSIPPKIRLETALPDEELVRLYRLAMKEGWFEPKEREIIFTFIKAFDSQTDQYQLDERRSQLLSLPDVLNRYRPPPEHLLDFPKDGVGVQCDINFSNRLALHNSQMLRCYNLSDPRVRPMVLFVKAWAKRRNINSAYHGTLSSYGYVLMVLHYLVHVTQPPICLNLQTTVMAQRDTSDENTTMLDGYNVRFWRDEQKIQQWARDGRITADHNSSVGSLLRGFFHYFAVVAGGFSWGTDVLSLRTPGGIVSKQQKGWVAAKTVVLEAVVDGQKGQEIRQRYLFAIEDPFEIHHNVARTVVHNGIVAIRDEFRRAHRLIQEAGDGMFTEDLFEEAAAKDDLNYRHFGPRPRPHPDMKVARQAPTPKDHGPKEPSNPPSNSRKPDDVNHAPNRPPKNASTESPRTIKESPEGMRKAENAVKSPRYFLRAPTFLLLAFFIPFFSPTIPTIDRSTKVPAIMRLSIVCLVALTHLALSSVIPAKLARFSNDVAVASLPKLHSVPFIGGLIKRQSTPSPQCKSVKVKQKLCPREPGPQVSLDFNSPPGPACYVDEICCGEGCNGLDIVGPASKRDVMADQPDDTVMKEPNMKPLESLLVKRQDNKPPAPKPPKVGKDVTIYENGQLLDDKYAEFFTCKLPTKPQGSPLNSDDTDDPAPSHSGGLDSDDAHNPPSTPETVFSIGYYRHEYETRAPTYAEAVFAGGGIGEREACDSKWIFREVASTPGLRPPFPEKITWYTPGRKNCEFNRLGDSEAGGLTCSGVLAKCSKVSGDPKPVKCKSTDRERDLTWRTQVLCIF